MIHILKTPFQRFCGAFGIAGTISTCVYTAYSYPEKIQEIWQQVSPPPPPPKTEKERQIEQIRQNPRDFPRLLRNDLDIATIAIALWPGHLAVAGEEIRKDKRIVLSAVSVNGNMLQYADAALRNDPEVVLAAVRSTAEALKDAGPIPQDNFEVVETAVRSNGYLIHRASKRLRKHPHLIVAAIHSKIPCGSALWYAGSDLLANREVVLSAVKADGDALRFAPQFWKDREVFKAALQSNGTMLYLDNRAFAGDREMVEAAITSNGGALCFASKQLQDDFAIVKKAVQSTPEAIEWASGRLRANPEIADLAAKKPAMIRWIHHRDTVLRLVQKDGMLLQHAHPYFRADRTIVLEAMKNNKMAFWDADPALRKDPGIKKAYDESFRQLT